MHAALQTAITDFLNADAFFVGPPTIFARPIKIDGSNFSHVKSLIDNDIAKTGLALIVGFPTSAEAQDRRILPVEIKIGLAEHTVINRGDIGSQNSIDCVMDKIIELLTDEQLAEYSPLEYMGYEPISEAPSEVLESELTFSCKTVIPK